MSQNSQTFLSEIFSNKEELLIMIFLVPFFLRILINSAIINERDGTDKNVMMLNPIKQSSYDFFIEALFRFWWPAKDGKSFAKTFSNILSLITLISLITLFMNSFIENVFLN
jgi:hypothetical protein